MRTEVNCKLISIFDSFRDVNFASSALRLILCVICGGLIGLERAYKNRPAGFRTHILICLGAAMTTLTSQYMYLILHYYTDMARLGAQVIAGIGFIGAGTIIVTRHKQVKGLTTAAGLWVSAIIGLAIGAGFYEGGIIATLLTLTAELLFSKIEDNMAANSPQINLYIEYKKKSCMEKTSQLLRESNIKITDIQTESIENDKMCAVISIIVKKNHDISRLIDKIYSVSGITYVDRL